MIFKNTQNVARVKFIDGAIDAAGNGPFAETPELQYVLDGTTWLSVSNWTLTPEYVTTSSAGGQVYVFSGPMLSGVKGVRITARVNIAGYPKRAIVREVLAFGP
jgi:hypothetical protein